MVGKSHRFRLVPWHTEATRQALSQVPEVGVHTAVLVGSPDGLTYKQWGCIWPVVEAGNSKIKGLRAFSMPCVLMTC